MQIQIIKFINKYQNEVKSMVFDGLNDTAKNHNNNVKLAIKNYLKRSLNEDLGSIYAHYNDNGIFYVALNEEGEVVGSLGAEYVDGNKFRLKRLSVKIGFRNSGIAKKLLYKVEKWVLDKNGNELILGTSEIQEKANLSLIEGLIDYQKKQGRSGLIENITLEKFFIYLI